MVFFMSSYFFNYFNNFYKFFGTYRDILVCCVKLYTPMYSMNFKDEKYSINERNKWFFFIFVNLDISII